MAISVDNITSFATTAVSSLTLPFTIGTGADVQLVAFVNSVAINTAPTLTYNGSSLVASMSNQGQSHSYIHSFLQTNPVAGSNNLVVNYSTTTDINVVTYSLFGVNPTTPTGTNVSTSVGGGTGINDAVTTNSGGMAVDMIVKGYQFGNLAVSTFVAGMVVGANRNSGTAEVRIGSAYLSDADHMGWTWTDGTLPFTHLVLSMQASTTSSGSGTAVKAIQRYNRLMRE